MLLPLHERRKKYEIIKRGKDSEFWKTLKESFIRLSVAKGVEIEECLRDNNTIEAQLLSAEKRLLDRIITEPEIIINANQTIFEKFVYEACQACGHVLQKIKPKTEEELTKGGADANRS